MKRLIAGPWVGEFGWELMKWQSYVRFESINFDETVIISRPGHQCLYEDFYSKYIEYPCDGNTCCHLCNDRTHNEYLEHIRQPGDTLLPAKFIPYEDYDGSFSRQKFIKYGKNNDKSKFDLLIHARSTTKGDSAIRNWSMDNWNGIAKHFLQKNMRVACIGTSNQSSHVHGTENMMDIPLTNLVDIMASSELIVGVSSGPLHLASMCGTTHIVITGRDNNEGNKERYEKIWNPLGTRAIVIDSEGWNPKIQTVLETIKDALKK